MSKSVYELPKITPEYLQEMAEKYGCELGSVRQVFSKVEVTLLCKTKVGLEELVKKLKLADWMIWGSIEYGLGVGFVVQLHKKGFLI